MNFTIVLLLVLLGVLVYDAVVSMLARRMGFNYAYASVGSLLIYFAGGFAAAKVANFEWVWLVGVAAGITDATLGWWISWAIGPGRLPGGKLSFSEWISAATFSVVLGTVCAAAGVWVAIHAA